MPTAAAAASSSTTARRVHGKPARYGVAVLTVAAAAALNLALLHWLHPQVTPLFFAAVMIAGWFGGLGPGLVATVLATLISLFFFIDPVYSFHITTEDLIHLGVFLAVATLISWLNERRKLAESALEGARLDLEQKVEARTADLARINRE